MDLMQSAFIFALILCVMYAGIVGGRTGRAGAVIFSIATLFSVFGAMLNPTWASTSYALLLVDAACLLALIALALHSNRFWPIWAMGFQTVAVATHAATMWIPDIVPRAYQALLSFWSIPILWVMVAGTRRDHKYDRGQARKG